MPLEVMRTIASLGRSILGSGTSSTRTSRLPCHTTPFMTDPLSRNAVTVRTAHEAERRLGRFLGLRLGVPAMPNDQPALRRNVWRPTRRHDGNAKGPGSPGPLSCGGARAYRLREPPT